MSIHQLSASTRRRLPRIEASLALQVKAECGLLFDTTTKNISQTGLLILVDRCTFKQLTKNQRLSEMSQPAEVDIKMSLPVEPDTSIEVHTHCKLLQFRRISKDRYHIGLEYSALSKSAHDELTRYIQDAAAYSRNWPRCKIRSMPLAAAHSRR